MAGVNETDSGVSQPAGLQCDALPSEGGSQGGSHQEERRIARDGNVYTFREFLDHYGEEWIATYKWSAAQDTPPPPPPLQENVQAAAVNTLLTPRTAEQIRTSTRIAGTCKKEMRAFFILDATSNSQPRDPHVFAFDIPADVSWRHYIARHPQSTQIVGSGITRAQLMLLPEGDE